MIRPVSAAHFSVRMLVESLLTELRTRRDDKIANALGRKLGEEARMDFLFLFERRKEADHRSEIFGEEEAREIISRAEALFNHIMDALGGDRSGK